MTPAEEKAFSTLLTSLYPTLYCFAKKLTQSADVDDLVQDAMVNAWKARERWDAGTSEAGMRSWTFIILRNLFYSQVRRRRFQGEWDDLVAEVLLSAPAHQEDGLHLADALAALGRLPAHQSEAVVLVAMGEHYEDAAETIGVPVGTIKSRVTRGRSAMIADLEAA